MTTQQLSRPLVNQLLNQAQSSPETEVCGLVGEDESGNCRLYPIHNIAAQPERLFQMDPAEQINAMRIMREQGQKLFAIYHSHPHSPAIPSTTDLTEAEYPEALYLIISLNTKGVLEMRGYRYSNKEMIEISLEI